MVQPKYSPQEALEKVKLMMKYDTSKTLTENKNIVSEQQIGTKTAIGTGIGAGIGAATGAALPTSLSIGAGASGAIGTGAASGLVYSTAGALGVSMATAGAIVGGAAALAVVPLVMWLVDKDNAKPKVQRMVQYCTSDAAKVAKVPRGINDGEIRDLSDSLYDAMEGIGTDEEKVYSAFRSVKTASDFCALVNRFAKDYGDIIEWLDDDFDQSSEWEQIFRPLRNAVEDTLMTIKDDTVEEDCKKNPNLEKCKKVVPTPRKSKWRTDCKGTYTQGCLSSKVGEIQACLGGLTVDNKFGPKTAEKLKEKGFGSSFSDADIAKICGKKEIEKPEISGEIEQNNVDEL